MVSVALNINTIYRIIFPISVGARRCCFFSQTNFNLPASLHVIIRTRKATRVRNEIAEVLLLRERT